MQLTRQRFLRLQTPVSSRWSVTALHPQPTPLQNARCYFSVARGWGITAISDKALQSLTSFPNRCPIVSAAEGLEGVVRQLKFGNHMIYFEITPEIVMVLSVQHVRQRSFPE